MIQLSLKRVFHSQVNRDVEINQLCMLLDAEREAGPSLPLRLCLWGTEAHSELFPFVFLFFCIIPMKANI